MDQTKDNSSASASSQVDQTKITGTILLIEDDLPMAKMYSTKLGAEGFRTEVAYDGEQGLKKIKEGEIDLVLLDLMIPKMGGMDVLEKAKEEEKTKKIPIVILSNLSQERDMQRARQLGVKHFLIKSNYTPSQVVGVVKSYFGSPAAVEKDTPETAL